MTTIPRVHFKRFFTFQFSLIKILLTAIFYYLLFSTAVLGQDVTSIDETEKKIGEIESWFDGGINCLVHFAGAISFSTFRIKKNV